ncbi:MAG: tetratricopeptide repeat protein, partial [Acidobacteria bacterium]|nr:tetratricopeptide repeat protein [Acidobacteriota bacterium]
VLERDPTQLVANRLLVEAYIGQSEHAKATRRLDLYRLLNDGDPVIEELQERLEATAPAAPVEEDGDGRFFEAEELEAPAETADLADPDEPFSELLSSPAGPSTTEPVEEVEEPLEEDLFPELHQEISHKRYLEGLVGEGIFVTEIPAEPEPQAASAEALVPEMPAGEPEGWVEDLGEGLETTVDEEPFPELPQAVEAAAATPAEEDRLFDLPGPAGLGATPEPLADLLEPAAPEVAEDVSAGLPAVSEEAAAEPPPRAPEIEDESTAGDGGGEASAEGWQEESEEETEEDVAPEAGAEELATVTLGNLYLDQGHREKAEKVFRKVLEREPGNAAARSALASLEEAPKTEDEGMPEE